MTDLQTEIIDFLIGKNYLSPWIRSGNAHNDLFAGASSITTLKKKNFLFFQGEQNKYIYIVRTGRLRIFYLDNSGAEKCVYIVENGGMIGEISAFDKKSNYVSAYAITDATLFKINITDFLRIMSLHPAISLEIIQSLNYKVRLLCSQMEYSVKSSPVRVAAALLAMCGRYGESTPDGGIRISIRFTHEELAHLINLNRVTVSKIFGILLQNNVIANDGRYISVKNIESLKQYLE